MGEFQGFVVLGLYYLGIWPFSEQVHQVREGKPACYSNRSMMIMGPHSFMPNMGKPNVHGQDEGRATGEDETAFVVTLGVLEGGACFFFDTSQNAWRKPISPSLHGIVVEIAVPF